MKRILPLLFFVTSLSVRSQDFLGMQSSNYSGVIGVFSNPANIGNNEMKFDLILVGMNFSAANNYVGAKRSSVKNTGSLFSPKFGKWDTTNAYNNLIAVDDNNKSKSIYTAARFMMPSFMVNINHKNAIAFTWGVRNYVNVDGIGPDLARLAYGQFKIADLLNKPLVNDKLSVTQMAWAEYGLTYSRVLTEETPHFFKVGVTAKLLQGLEAAYMNMDHIDYNFKTPDSLALNAEASYGHSANLDPVVNSFDEKKTGEKFTFNTLKKNYKYESYPGFGFDLGVVYEYRPDWQKEKYDMDGKKGLWRNDHVKYKFKAGLAVTDIGGIRFKKGQLSNDFSANTEQFKSGFWYLHDLKPQSITQYDSLLKNTFGSKESETTFKMALPTAINANVDYHIWKPFYINLMANITNFQKNRYTKVHDYTNISLAPRIDYKWFGLTIPVSYNTLSAVRGKPIVLGTMLRLGPLMLGSNNVSELFFGDVFGANFYCLLRVPIPYYAPKDKDKDGISDKKDKCKLVPGVWEFMGCPDRDGDHIPDVDDKCPDIPGIKELQGCPDKDGDGITDAEDACPDEKGPAEFKGCPDRDGDNIIDKEDECPDEAGIKEFMGCPDKDGDGTPDKYDICPDVFGPKEYKGCPDRDGDGTLDKEDACVDVPGPKENKGCPWPDTDKDGIIDKEDACPTIAGTAQYKGCPPPPPMKAAELKIIEKAFSSLEFATAKDIIKPKSFPSLNDLAKLLNTHKGDWKLKLSGHTDNEGNADKNMLLSEKRSKAVKTYLSKKGVPADNILTEWFGQTMPVADNATPAGRQKNRRVEMKIIFKEEAPK